jgi:hypothetical protein
MLPGLAILIQPMKSAAGNLKCFIAYKPIRVPVLPRPALQWIASAPGSASEIFRNSSTIFYGGVEPSIKNKSECCIPFLIKRYLSYLASFSRTTLETLK